MSLKYIGLSVFVGFLLGIIVIIGVSNTPLLNTQDSASEYTQLHVAYGQRVTLEIMNNTFGFEIDYWYPDNFFVHSGSAKERFKIQEGEIFQVYGLEVVLKEAKSDYLTLLVKPV